MQVPAVTQKWPMVTTVSPPNNFPVQVVYSVPDVGIVTEIIDWADPIHQRMIERARNELHIEVISVTSVRARSS